MIPVFTSLIAILLPVYVLCRRYKNKPTNKAYLFSIGSFASALAAICLELHTIELRAAAGDFAGIGDTIGAVLVICIGISVVTVLLNSLALWEAYKK